MSSLTEKAPSREAEKESGDRILTTETGSRRKRGCLGRLKPCWWLLLSILIAIVLIVVLPIIFVAVPKMVRKTINDSKLTVQGISVLNTTPDSYQISLNATIASKSSHKATIDAFNASFYLEDKLPHTPFLSLQMPQTVSHRGAIVNITQDITITDQRAFADYNAWALQNESLLVTVDGWTHVHVSGLPSTKVHFLKTLNLTGFNSFAGMKVISSEIVLDGTDNFLAFISIPNPSVLTLDIGNATFLAQFLTTTIGTTHIDNMLLVPGPNNLSIRANISAPPIYEAVLQEPYCKTGILPVSFVGQNITKKGEELPYFVEAFVGNPLSLDLDVGGDLKPLGLSVVCVV